EDRGLAGDGVVLGRTVQRQRVDEQPWGGMGIGWSVLQRKVLDLALVEVRAAPPYHHRDRNLAFDQMRYRHYRDIGDVRMRQQQTLYLHRVNILAAAIEHVVRSALEKEKPVCVPAEQIAGAQPAVDDALAIDLRKIVIAGRDAWILYP